MQTYPVDINVPYTPLPAPIPMPMPAWETLTKDAYTPPANGIFVDGHFSPAPSAQVFPDAKPHPKAATHSQMSKRLKHWKRKSSGWRRKYLAALAEHEEIETDLLAALQISVEAGSAALARASFLEAKCAKNAVDRILHVMSDPTEDPAELGDVVSGLAIEALEHLRPATNYLESGAPKPR